MFNYRQFKEINELFAQGQFAKARHRLMEVQSHCIALQDEMERLKIRLQTMEDILYLRKNLFEEHGFYWLRTAGGVKQGPFCPHCYELEGGLVRLEKRIDQGLICPYCNSTYTTSLLVPALKPVSAEQGKTARILQFGS